MVNFSHIKVGKVERRIVLAMPIISFASQLRPIQSLTLGPLGPSGCEGYFFQQHVDGGLRGILGQQEGATPSY